MPGENYDYAVRLVRGHGVCPLRLKEPDRPDIQQSEGDDMKRYGMVIGLRPEAEKRYREFHSNVWPGVLQKIQECNIRNYSIYCKDGKLFSYFEYHGSDFAADMARMAADKTTQEWWAIMEPMQDPVPTRKEGEWWASMEEVFHVD